MEEIKLNLGASPIWNKSGWHVLDHKIKKTEKGKIAGDAIKMDIPNNSCKIVFCSHVFEHIPHTKLPLIISEINRVLKKDGVLRILTPDLAKTAKAYVEKDTDFFNRACQEDTSIRKDLGFGGMLMSFIVTSGQDTILLNRDLNEFISGYAHLYNYDFEMMETILQKLGFKGVVKSEFCKSEIEEMREPLHIEGLEPVWQNLNDDLYLKHGLVHKQVNDGYEINFNLTGFDRDPLTSLIVEAKKDELVNLEKANEIFNLSTNNYNRYGKSLLKNKEIIKKLKNMDINYKL